MNIPFMDSENTIFLASPVLQILSEKDLPVSEGVWSCKGLTLSITRDVISPQPYFGVS